MPVKRTFKDLTVVSVTGSADYIQGAIYAIMRSCQELKGAKGLLISPPLPAGVHLPPYIEHQLVSPFSYLEYNLFILYQLDYFIHTDFCLIVQSDGWVLNGKNWRDEFWDYDYIGAPIPMFAYYKHNTFHLSDSAFYFNNPQLINDPHYIVPQNGGFSLRSKRLLGMPRRMNLFSPIDPPMPVELQAGKPYKMEWEEPFHNEDTFLSARFRRHLEQQGIRFAPHLVACFFAMETTSIQQSNNIPLDQVMGAHWCGTMTLVGEWHIHIRLNETFSKYTDQQILDAIDVKLVGSLGYRFDISRET